MLAAISLLAAAAFFWMRMHAPRGNVAAVFLNGEQVYAFSLSEYTEPAIVSMAQLGYDVPVNFELKDQRIRFIDVDCPDKLCEGFGFIGQENETAVCMPNRVSVTIIA